MAGKYGTFGVGVDLPSGVLERQLNPHSILGDVLQQVLGTIGKSGVFGEAADERKARLAGETRQAGRAPKAPAEQWEVTEDGSGVRRVGMAEPPDESDPRDELMRDMHEAADTAPPAPVSDPVAPPSAPGAGASSDAYEDGPGFRLRGGTGMRRNPYLSGFTAGAPQAADVAPMPQAATAAAPAWPPPQGGGPNVANWAARRQAFERAQAINQANWQALTGMSKIPARGKFSEALQAVRLNRDQEQQAWRIAQDYAAQEIAYAKDEYEAAVKERDTARQRSALEALRELTLAEVRGSAAVSDQALSVLEGPELLSADIYDSYRKAAVEHRERERQKGALHRNTSAIAMSILGRDLSDDEAATVGRMIDDGATQKDLEGLFSQLQKTHADSIDKAAARLMAEREGVDYIEGEPRSAVESRVRLARDKERVAAAKRAAERSEAQYEGHAVRGNLRGMREAMQDLERQIESLNEKVALSTEPGAQEVRGSGALAEYAPTGMAAQLIDDLEARLSTMQRRYNAVVGRYHSLSPAELRARGLTPEDLLTVGPDGEDMLSGDR